MIIIILSILALIVCTVFTIKLFRKSKLPFRTMDEQKELLEKDKKEYLKTDVKENASIAVALFNIILALFVLVSIILAVARNVPAYRDDIIEEKALIIYKIEHGEYETDADMVEDIGKFNDTVATHRKCLDNPWVNWYYSRHYKTIEPINYTIDIDGVVYR